MLVDKNPASLITQRRRTRIASPTSLPALLVRYSYRTLTPDCVR